MKHDIPPGDTDAARLRSIWPRGATRLRGAVGAAICSGGLLVLLSDLVAWQMG